MDYRAFPNKTTETSDGRPKPFGRRLYVQDRERPRRSGALTALGLLALAVGAGFVAFELIGILGD